MQETLIEERTLENGLKIGVWDVSRPLAGDRWLVSLEVRADIPLELDLLKTIPERERTYELLSEVFGPTIPYRYIRKKHFVAGTEKEGLFREFVETFDRDVAPYLAHGDFGHKVLLAKLRELKTTRPQLFSSS
jgi:hypothetical protein